MVCINDNTFGAGNSNYNFSNLAKNLLNQEDILSLNADPVARYDKTVLLKITNTFNDIAKYMFGLSNTAPTTDKGITIPTYNLSPFSYPTIKDRINQSDFTYTEIADYMSKSFFTEDYLLDSLYTNTAIPFGQLEYYYDNNLSNSIAGGFCSAFGNTYLKILAYTSILTSGVKTLEDLINFEVSSIIDGIMGLKDRIFSIIDGIVGNVRNQINQIYNYAIGKVKNASAIIQLLGGKQGLQSLLDDNSINEVKKDVEELLAKMTGQYEKLTPDTIAFLLFRMCQFVESVQAFFQNPVEYFGTWAESIVASSIIYNNTIQGDVYHRMAYTGVLGLPLAQIEALRAQAYKGLAGSNWSPIRGGGSIPTTNTPPVIPPLSAEDIATGNDWTIVGNDSGFSSVYTQYMTLADSVMNMGQNFPDAGPRDGWELVDARVWAMVYLLGKRLGKQLMINSAYRSPMKNASLSGSAKNSLHMRGQAVDISYTTTGSGGSIDPIELIKNASIIGFQGIGYYSTFIHVDVGKRRIWNEENAPAKIAEAMAIHLSQSQHFIDTYNSNSDI